MARDRLIMVDDFNKLVMIPEKKSGGYNSFEKMLPSTLGMGYSRFFTLQRSA